MIKAFGPIRESQAPKSQLLDGRSNPHQRPAADEELGCSAIARIADIKTDYPRWEAQTHTEIQKVLILRDQHKSLLARKGPDGLHGCPPALEALVILDLSCLLCELLRRLPVYPDRLHQRAVQGGSALTAVTQAYPGLP
jgi:hypothetical protein